MSIKLKVPVILLVALMSATTSLAPITAKAAKYHPGMPKKFRGHWKSKQAQIRIRKNSYDTKLKVSTGWIMTYGHPKVKALGHNKYRVRSFTYRSNCWLTESFVYISKNKIKFDGTQYVRY